VIVDAAAVRIAISAAANFFEQLCACNEAAGSSTLGKFLRDLVATNHENI